MEQISINDFSGGVVENVSPSDFSGRQWAQLKGFVPASESVMESQWSLQRCGTPTQDTGNPEEVGNNRNWLALHALATEEGVFLIGIKDGTAASNAGSVWFTKAAGPSAGAATADEVLWTRIDKNTSGVAVTKNENYRFLTEVTYEAYKYDQVTNIPADATTPAASVSTDDDTSALVPGVLIGARLGDDAGRNDAMLVAFYNQGASDPRLKIRIAEFPMASRKASGVTTLTMYPYSYTNSAGTLFPGKGTIPAANDATMWGNALILGDVFWKREDATVAAGNSDVAQVLNAGNTYAHEGSILYGEDDIDKFDPRSVIKLSNTGTGIRGMHMLDATLIAITEYGGEGDGVIGLRGNLGALHPYDGSQANPYAIRKELIRGGVGATRLGTGDRKGQKPVSCVWPEAGLVVFIDRMGGVFYTNGETCDRLDQNAPTIPGVANVWDHVGAVGKHLFVWRDKRWWCLTIMSNTADGASSAAWTELVPPGTPSEHSDLRSMVGAREELYFLWNRAVWRVALKAPAAERGKAHTGASSTTLDLVVSTRTVATPGEFEKPLWHRFGMTFETPATCTVKTVAIQSVGALKEGLSSWVSSLEPAVAAVGVPQVPATNTKRLAYVKWTLDREFDSDSEGDFAVPAGVGSQAQVSATVVFNGYVRLQSASFWVTGVTGKRGEVPE